MQAMETPHICEVRKCSHFIGYHWDSNDRPGTEVAFCRAFPKGIPETIACGTTHHQEVLSGLNGKCFHSVTEGERDA